MSQNVAQSFSLSPARTTGTWVGGREQPLCRRTRERKPSRRRAAKKKNSDPTPTHSARQSFAHGRFGHGNPADLTHPSWVRLGRVPSGSALSPASGGRRFSRACPTSPTPNAPHPELTASLRSALRAAIVRSAPHRGTGQGTTYERIHHRGHGEHRDRKDNDLLSSLCSLRVSRRFRSMAFDHPERSRAKKRAPRRTGL